MSRTRRTVAAALVTTWVYSTLMLAYLAVNSVAHPQTLVLPLSHLARWPTEGTAAVMSGLLSIGSFAGWRYLGGPS